MVYTKNLKTQYENLTYYALKMGCYALYCIKIQYAMVYTKFLKWSMQYKNYGALKMGCYAL